jgi:uncharacterized membrane protein
MMIFKEYSVSSLGLVLILLSLIISGVTRRTNKTSNNFGWVVVSMIVLGIIFGNSEKWLGSAFFGIAVIISIIDMLRKMQNKKNE